MQRKLQELHSALGLWFWVAGLSRHCPGERRCAFRRLLLEGAQPRGRGVQAPGEGLPGAPAGPPSLCSWDSWAGTSQCGKNRSLPFSFSPAIGLL